MKRLVPVILFVILSFTLIACVNQPDETYAGTVSSRDGVNYLLSMKMVLSEGSVIKELTLGSVKIDLADNGMVKDGFIRTRDYGNFKIIINAKDKTFQADLTPSQLEKLNDQQRF